MTDKPIFTIQQTPKFEWRVTKHVKGPLSYVFPTEAEAIRSMEIMVKGEIKNYDAEGKLIT